MKRKKLFLKWALTTLLTLVIVFLAFTLARTQAEGLSVVGKIMAGAIGLIYVVATAYCGMICWKTDNWIDQHLSKVQKEVLDKLKHRADFVDFASNKCPQIGLLGAAAGIFLCMSTNLSGLDDAAHIKEAVAASLAGIGVAFLPTIVGVFFQVVLSFQYYLV